MLKNVAFGLAFLVAGWAMAADSPQDQVKAAAKALGDKANYSFKSTVESPGGGGRGFGGPTEGKTEKDGFTTLKMTRGDNVIEAVVKGEKGAVKMGDAWQSFAEAAEAGGGQGGGGGRFIGRMLQTYQLPAAQAADLAGKVKELKKDGDALAGDLTEEGVKQLLAFRGRAGGDPPPAPTGAKGTAKFWIKDGVLSKYQFNVQGTMTFNNNDIQINRTTTVEISDVGTTKVEVPEAAKAKAQ